MTGAAKVVTRDRHEEMLVKRSLLWSSALCVVALACVLALDHIGDDPVVATVGVGRLPWRVVVDEQHGRAFVVNRGDGSVSVLDSGTGALLRTVAVGTDPVAAAVDERTARVFVANGGDATVSILDARSGVVLRTVVVGTSPQWLTVDRQSGHVFVPNRSDNTVSVLDARNGAVLRTVTVCLFPFAAAVDERTARVFVRCNSGWVVTLDARTVAVLRATRTGAAPWGQIAVDERTARVFVTNPHDKTVSVLDARSGAVVRTVHIGIDAYRPIMDERAGRVIVVGPANGRGGASVLDADSGVVLRTVVLGYTPWPAAVSIRSGSVLIAAAGTTDSMGDAMGNGTVSMLDAHGDGGGRAVPVGVFPVDIGVDGRTGRVFVVNYNARWSDGGPVAHSARDGWWVAPQRWLAGHFPLIPPPRRPRPSTTGSVTILDISRL